MQGIDLGYTVGRTILGCAASLGVVGWLVFSKE